MSKVFFFLSAFLRTRIALKKSERREKATTATMKLKGRQHITRERDPDDDDECYKTLLLSLLRPRVQYSHSYTNIYSGSGTKATYRKVWWIFSFFFCLSLCVNEWRLFRRLYLFLTRNYYWTARHLAHITVPFTCGQSPRFLRHKNVDLKRQTRRETAEKIPIHCLFKMETCVRPEAADFG